MIVETLRVFVTVAEQKNFSRAAELLNLSQPGVSLQIRNLENEFGAKLMHRSPKLVKLTVAGEILYKRAKVILSLYEEAKEDIHLLRDVVTGSIRIGASFTIGEYILPRLLAEFVHHYPEVDIQVHIGNTEEIAQAVRSNSLDLGLVEGEVSHPDLTVTPYMKDEMTLIVSPEHPLSHVSAGKAQAAMLQDQVWILRESGSGTRAFSEQYIQDAGLVMKRSYVFNSSQGVKEAVAAGLGIAILSRLVVRKELEAGEICEIPIDGKIGRDFSIIQNKDHSAAMAVSVFVERLLAKSEYKQP
ncbi:LysR family transcriptional regulator [Paenibacillus eucommiae]|uniref:DNA-binding transcriptional LysR family regulator n=1 Tax=Paenibacillus eucommiae TaxID=1355755 RepID=A0ABS4IPN6_9BACL|nr:LysR family transcriptional regulator [Paenibacillus eucommiae]MBP1989473.1 DNA-binding transcriptional LysR family regulator [Paenibacillus eucommiae]